MSLKTRIRGALETLSRVFYSGTGAILCLHRVTLPEERSLLPDNRALEITPDGLEALIRHLQDRRYDIIPLDEVPGALGSRRSRKFIAFTFDDGYLDNLRLGLPIFRARGVPFAINITTGFVNRSAIAWWHCLEELLGVLESVKYSDGSREYELPLGRLEDKHRAFEQLAKQIRNSAQEQREPFIRSLFSGTGLDPAAISARLMMDWDGVRQLAAESLVTIGAHTVTHPTLNLLSPAQLRSELHDAKIEIEARLQRQVRHLAYPFGGPNAVGPREFEAARECGFVTAATTRTANLFRAHTAHLHSLPRISISGNYPIVSRFCSVESGLLTARIHRFRRVVT
ncbi:MAG: polysaccharide deacetylase family protein [Verrucomicrobiota bacterium]